MQPLHGMKALTLYCRGQYSDATLNELESQNDGEVEGILGKVRQLKDVRHNCTQLSQLALLDSTDVS